MEIRFTKQAVEYVERYMRRENMDGDIAIIIAEDCSGG